MNSHFQFKQFIIHQDRCTMKVTEVACLLGALCPIENASNAIDIGGGTGLLSLMLAQRSHIKVDLVELDLNAFEQAIQNITSSPFSSQITCHNQDIRNFEASSKYDLIISNPPFFENQLPSPNQEKNRARHSTDLSLLDLIASVDKLLSYHGKFVILFPSAREQELNDICSLNSLFLKKIIHIKHSELHSSKLIIAIFSRLKTVVEVQEFILKNNNSYSNEFKILMKEFYLNL
jgi:tRNA1Val (adenine37-N6)-methyltransferase